MTDDAFRIFCLCLIKNEADIIEYCLEEASKWADRIFVMDNGSSDGTWEKVSAIANDRIVAWKTDGKPFSDALRAEIFNAFRHEASSGDWWCKLDADEFCIDHPRAFLAQVSGHEHVVWGIPVEYYLTSEDIGLLDFTLPIDQRLEAIRYYAIRNSEVWFFRHRWRLQWPAEAAWPRHMGLVHRRRILFRHYKYRSPDQIQLRLDTRRQAIESGFDGWWKSSPTRWEEQIQSNEGLAYDTGDGHYQYDPTTLPKHMEDPWKRVVKLVFHGIGLWP